MKIEPGSFIPVIKRFLPWLWRIPLAFLAVVSLYLLVFRWAPVNTSAFMLQHQVASMLDAEIPPPSQQWIDLKDISPHMQLAVIAAEDQQFPEHWGLDLHATRAAIYAEMNGRGQGGGSTITQQVAKNLFLWQGRSYLRKGLEWLLAAMIEIFWSKERILEVYLNVAQFSAADYGVKAASSALLDSSSEELTESQSALLASVLPSPVRYDAKEPSPYVLKRQRWILKQMRQLGGAGYLQQLR